MEDASGSSATLKRDDDEDAFSKLKRYKVSKVAKGSIKDAGLKKLRDFAATRKKKLEDERTERQRLDEAVRSYQQASASASVPLEQLQNASDDHKLEPWERMLGSLK